MCLRMMVEGKGNESENESDAVANLEVEVEAASVQGGGSRDTLTQASLPTRAEGTIRC